MSPASRLSVSADLTGPSGSSQVLPQHKISGGGDANRHFGRAAHDTPGLFAGGRESSLGHQRWWRDGRDSLVILMNA